MNQYRDRLEIGRPQRLNRAAALWSSPSKFAYANVTPGTRDFADQTAQHTSTTVLFVPQFAPKSDVPSLCPSPSTVPSGWCVSAGGTV